MMVPSQVETAFHVRQWGLGGLDDFWGDCSGWRWCDYVIDMNLDTIQKHQNIQKHEDDGILLILFRLLYNRYETGWIIMT